MRTLTWILVAICVACLVEAQSTAPPPAPTPDTSATPRNAAPDKAPLHSAATDTSKPIKAQAWGILHSGVKENSAAKRAIAVRVLSLLTNDRAAIRLAIRALADDKPSVRAAAAMTLGELQAKSAIPKLEKALSDKDPEVALAAAHALLTMKNARAYDVFYEILTGERKATKGVIAGQLDTLKDPSKVALLGFEEGIGFVPFAGIGYTAIKTIMKDDSTPVRAAAARVLTSDRDPATEDALIHAATSDSHELVRTAALDALAKRGDPAVIARITSCLSDDKDSVKYTAGAAIVHLENVAEHRKAVARQAALR